MASNPGQWRAAFDVAAREAPSGVIPLPLYIVTGAICVRVFGRDGRIRRAIGATRGGRAAPMAAGDPTAGAIGRGAGTTAPDPQGPDGGRPTCPPKWRLVAKMVQRMLTAEGDPRGAPTPAQRDGAPAESKVLRRQFGAVLVRLGLQRQGTGGRAAPAQGRKRGRPGRPVLPRRRDAGLGSAREGEQVRLTESGRWCAPQAVQHRRGGESRTQGGDGRDGGLGSCRAPSGLSSAPCPDREEERRWRSNTARR